MPDGDIFTTSRIGVKDPKLKEDIAKNPSLIYSSSGDYSFGVEACQVAIEVKPIGEDVNDVPLLQEGWCNSWGHALAMRKNGFSYQEYVRFASNVVLTLPESGPSFRVLTISEKEYLSVSTEPIFTPNR